MTRDPAGDFGSHRRFDLAPLLKLPDGTEGEIDIEGLDVDGGYLWLIGSHSLKRKSPTKTMILKKISIVWRASTRTAIALPWAECLSATARIAGLFRTMVA